MDKVTESFTRRWELFRPLLVERLRLGQGNVDALEEVLENFYGCARLDLMVEIIENPAYRSLLTKAWKEVDESG